MMTKGRNLGYQVTYGNSAFVPGEMRRIFVELAGEDYLRGLNRESFAARLAYFYSELDSTHPFREGNGRTQREFIRQLGQKAGFEIRWAAVSRKQMIEASIASYTGDTGPLIDLLAANTAPIDQP